MKMQERKRRNLSLTVTREVYDYIEKETKRTGLTKSGLVAVALDVYRKQNLIAENLGSIEKLMDELRRVKGGKQNKEG